MSGLSHAIWSGFRAALLALACMLCWSGDVAAQLTSQQQDYVASWSKAADRAEQTIEANRASTAAFEGLREEIAQYRRDFEDFRKRNAARIETLESQMAALGPEPADGAGEPTDIAIMRGDLQKRIDELRVPVVISHEAYNRANGLINEIDGIIRDRKTQQVFTRTLSPLIPSLWPVAWHDLSKMVNNLFNETVISWNNAIERQQLRKSAPQILILLLAGMLFVLRGRHWAVTIGNYFRTFGGRGFGVWGFVISLGRIGFPLTGVYLLTRAISATQLLGLRGELILDTLPYWALLTFGFLWLADRAFPRHDEDAIFEMYPENRAPARRSLLVVGLLLVLQDMVSLVEQIENITTASRAIMGFPIIVVTSLVLLWQRQIIRRDQKMRGKNDDAKGARAGFDRARSVLRQLSFMVAVVAPLVAAVGYGALAEAAIYPYLYSIALFTLLAILQKFFGDLYAWLSGKGQAAEDSVVPVLISFFLLLCSLPVLALIWGARVADLTELWERFLNGVRIGDTQISPTDFLAFALVFVVGYSLTRMFQRALANNLLPKTKLDPGGQNAVVSGVGYVGIFLAVIVAVSTAGIDLSSLAIVAGALSVGIGFGLQNIVSNFVSGIILLIERPISEGDWIEVGGNMGYVRDISVRSTRIETFDRTDVIVPNADLVSGTVTNFTRGNTIGRVIVPVGVAYGTDTRKVEAILREVAQTHPMILTEPAPGIVFQGFGADSLDFEIRAILRDVNWVLAVRSELNHEINRRFVEEGIEVPFGQRDIWLRNPEALSQSLVDASGALGTIPEKRAPNDASEADSDGTD